MDTVYEAEANVRWIITVGVSELLNDFYCPCSQHCTHHLGSGAGATEARELGSLHGTASRGVGLEQQQQQQHPLEAVFLPGSNAWVRAHCWGRAFPARGSRLGPKDREIQFLPDFYH